MNQLRTPWIVAMLCAACVVSSSCDTNTEEASIEGRWIGTETRDGVTIDIDLLITQSGTQIRGNGVFRAMNDTTAEFNSPVTVSGTYSDPDVSMSLRLASPNISFGFTGTITPEGNAIPGAVDGGDFISYAMSLNRQQRDLP